MRTIEIRADFQFLPPPRPLLTPLPVLQDELHHPNGDATFDETSAIWRIAKFGESLGI